MTDCNNAIRDVLPEYLHEQLSAADVATVEHHVASCRECASELALLRVALGVRPRAAAIDVASIVARLPRPGVPVSELAADPKVRALTSAPSVARRAPGRFASVRTWRAAAAITVVALGGISVAIARRGTAVFTPNTVTNDSIEIVAGNTITTGLPVTDSGAVALASAAADTTRSALPIGELADFSDDEIQSVIERLDKWDGAAAAEPLPGVPLLPVSSGVIP